jgi:hypothetical protein
LAIGEYPYESLVDQSIVGKEIRMRQAEGAATGIGIAAARLRDQRQAGSHIPTAQSHVPESIQASAGDIAEIQR